MNKQDTLGQFFTTDERVQSVMSQLIQTNSSGSFLEPSAGVGHLVAVLERRGCVHITPLELDGALLASRVCQTPIQRKDFFEHVNQRLIKRYVDGEYDCVFGNPPYVKLKNIYPTTRKLISSVYPGNANLYYLFIEEGIQLLRNRGELIFIVPKEWLYNTSASRLRTRIFREGSITHFIDCGETKLFRDAALPSLCIFRFEKGQLDRRCKYYDSLDGFLTGVVDERTLAVVNGALVFLPTDLTSLVMHGQPLSVYFDVKVGTVSGANDVFSLTASTLQEVDQQNVEYVITTKRVPQPFLNVNQYDTFDSIPSKTQKYLLRHKATLLNRKIAMFGENNWWKYGAVRNDEWSRSNRPRIFCLSKTRKNNAFWVGQPMQMYDGGVLALYPKDLTMNLEQMVRMFNGEQYRRIFQAFNLIVNNKINLTQSMLEKIPLLGS